MITKELVEAVVDGDLDYFMEACPSEMTMLEKFDLMGHINTMVQSAQDGWKFIEDNHEYTLPLLVSILTLMTIHAAGSAAKSLLEKYKRVRIHRGDSQEDINKDIEIAHQIVRARSYAMHDAYDDDPVGDVHLPLRIQLERLNRRLDQMEKHDVGVKNDFDRHPVRAFDPRSIYSNKEYPDKPLMEYFDIDGLNQLRSRIYAIPNASMQDKINLDLVIFYMKSQQYERASTYLTKVQQSNPALAARWNAELASISPLRVDKPSYYDQLKARSEASDQENEMFNRFEKRLRRKRRWWR